MKTRGLFLSALLMGAVMAGCANEEVMNNDNQKSLEKSDNYVAVNIVAPSDFGSRGTGGDYEAGSEKENAVENAWFVFYNANGGFVDAIEAELTMNDPDDDDTTIEKISTAMIVLSDPPTWPTQVVALLNTDYTRTQLAAMNLTQLKAAKGDFSATDYFVMSNSVYNDAAGKTVTATQLEDGQICKTEDDALANPVSIPVERVLAKVTVDAENVQYKGILDEDGDPVKTYLDGKEVVFEPVITGMALVQTNSVSYIVKNIDGVTGWNGWNVPGDWRSFWANSATPTNGKYESLSWNDITSQNDTEAYMAYCHENTSSTPVQLLVTAKFKVKGTSNYVNVIKYSGTYYTTQGLINQLDDLYFRDVYYMEGSTKTNDWSKYLEIVESTADKADPWEVEAKLKDNAPKPVDNVDLDDIMEQVNAKTMIQWTEGAAYYYTDIEHFGPAADGYGVGVVRNHWYDVKIGSITGVGSPVYDHDAEISPNRPDEEHYYLAAEVKILKWKMVSQTVDLQ